MEERCDGFRDCEDSSDEINCDIIITPTGYLKASPPPPLHHFENVKSELQDSISFAFIINSIRSFNLDKFKISVDTDILIKWKDSRLTYKNLRADKSLNKIRNIIEIWQPVLYVEDGTLSPAKFEIKLTYPLVERLGQATRPDITNVEEGDATSTFLSVNNKKN